MSIVKYKHLLIFVSLMLISCKKDKNFLVDVSEVKVKTELIAFNNEFYDPKNALANLKIKYPLLFNKETADKVWEEKKKNPVDLALQKEIIKNYGTYNKLKEDLDLLFKHIKYYYPQFKEPKVFLYTSGIEDFNEPITYVNDGKSNFLFISIDCFLNNSAYYSSFPAYIKVRMTKESLLPLICEKISETIIPRNFKNSNFLSLILLQGKKLVLADAFLPNLKENEKIIYTEKQQAWSVENEKNIWDFFTEQNLLFSNDPSLIQRFIDVAPFSKFYTAIDAQSPGSIGSWLGWRICKAYLNKNDVSLQEFISINNENLILKKSNYNPTN